MTRALVAINVVVHVLWLTAGRAEPWTSILVDHFLVSVESVSAWRLWTLLLAEFSHVDTLHLLFNMIGLWSFGQAVERVIGPWRLLHLYVVGALIASVGFLAYALVTNADNPALGASGAVNAIAVVFACLYPKARLYVNFFIPVPAAIAVVLFLLLDVIGALNPAGSTIAHTAHLGGALYGGLYYLFAVRPKLRRA